MASAGNDMRSLRTFISLNPDPGVLAKLGEIQSEVRRALVAHTRGGSGGLAIRWTEQMQIHLTLKFLGSISSSDAVWAGEILHDVVEEVGLPDLEIAGIGCFPVIRSPRVIWCGVRSNPRLTALYEMLGARLSERLELEDEGQYYPHLTLARIKRVRGVLRDNYEFGTRLEELSEKMSGIVVPWKVGSAFLMKSITRSSGPVHSILSQTGARTEGDSESYQKIHSPTLL